MSVPDRRRDSAAVIRWPWLWSVAALALLLASSAGADKDKTPARPIPIGTAKQDWDVDGTRLEVFTYKPKDYKKGPMLLVFHGVRRNADEYRDNAKALGDKFGALIVAPVFDKKRFPTRLYQQGGLLTEKGKVAPKDLWTWRFVPKLAEEVRQLEKRPDMPYYLLGHSGGGQFLTRLAGFASPGAERIVAANPGTHLFPSRDMAYPYGFGRLPDKLSDDDALRRYLAQPLTIYLGTADTKKDANLDGSEVANKQGDSRHRRGLNAFRSAEQLAKQKGWKFNWRLVEAADIGHDAKAMFADPKCGTALFGKK